MEALLVGHEDWVFSAAWQPDQASVPSVPAEPAVPCLLSASMDRTMMPWRPEASSGARSHPVPLSKLLRQACMCMQSVVPTSIYCDQQRAVMGERLGIVI